MTTIVYRDGIMAADSMLTDWGDIKRQTDKIFIMPDAVIGTAGDDGDILNFLDWWEAGHNSKKKPRRSSVTELHLIIVDATGKASIWAEDYNGEVVKEPFCSIGSGRGVAYGALEMGATAEQAVKAACKWNLNTREPIVMVDVYKTLGLKKRGRKS